MSVVEEVAFDDLYVALTTFDGLDTFRGLPLVDQRRFVRWIAKARGEAAYWSRVDTLVMAMRVAPTCPDKDLKLPEVSEAQ